MLTRFRAALNYVRGQHHNILQLAGSLGLLVGLFIALPTGIALITGGTLVLAAGIQFERVK